MTELAEVNHLSPLTGRTRDSDQDIREEQSSGSALCTFPECTQESTSQASGGFRESQGRDRG